MEADLQAIRDLVGDDLSAYESHDATGGRVFGASLNTLRRLADVTWKIRFTSLNELDQELSGFWT